MKGLLSRDGILFGRGFLPALLLTVLSGLVCFLAGYSVSRSISSDAAPVSVALVNEDDSVKGLIAVNAVKEAPFIKGMMEFVDTDLETALTGLREGRLEAVIHLPLGYINAISHGIPGKGYIYLSTSAASSKEIVRSIAAFGELMLVAGQQGVFVGEDLVLERGLSSEIHENYIVNVNVDLLDHAFSLFDGGSVVETTDYAGSGLPVIQSYAALWLAFFLLITGLFFGTLYTTDLRKGLLVRLYSGGVRPFAFL
ncbi:MAG: ABC transporter permease, partial [Lachnospiraceae bacterium]|nr:ABC transporter permease [Lachnospiraceae bacterium]